MENNETNQGYVPVPSEGVYIVEMGEVYQSTNEWRSTGHCTCIDNAHAARNWRSTAIPDSHEIHIYNAQLVEQRP